MQITKEARLYNIWNVQAGLFSFNTDFKLMSLNVFP